MADTTLGTGVAISRWSQRVFHNYTRANQFGDYTGKSPNNVFQVIMDLEKGAGDNIAIHLVTKLSGSPTMGDNQLEGQEEDLGNYVDTITVDQQRHAVSRGGHTQSKTLIDILKEAEFELKNWCADELRDTEVARLYAVNADGKTAYASTSEADKDTHLGHNTDRFLFGALLGNRSASDHSASLLEVDTTDDTLDRGIISLLRRIAKAATPMITPLRVDGQEEWYVAFVGTNAFRDLETDMDTTHQAATVRGKKNRVFHDTDIIHRSVITREVPEMESIGDVGAASAPVYPVAFCGLQAVGVAWAKTTQGIRLYGKTGKDYGNRRGVGVAETRGAKQLIWNDAAHGIVKGYVAAAADA